jgi:hypothetical protein
LGGGCHRAGVGGVSAAHAPEEVTRKRGPVVIDELALEDESFDLTADLLGSNDQGDYIGFGDPPKVRNSQV